MKYLAAVLSGTDASDRKAKQYAVGLFVKDLPGAYQPGATWLDRPGFDREEKAIGWFLGKYRDQELAECFLPPEAAGR